jgi:hypothetical protein
MSYMIYIVFYQFESAMIKIQFKRFLVTQLNRLTFRNLIIN